MKQSETRAAQLFLTHHGFVKGLALRYAPWPGIAEDVSQQVFVEFVGKADDWDLESDVRALLTVMTRNVALRHWRERTRSLPETLRQLAEHVQQLADERAAAPRYEEEIAALRRCLEKLPAKSHSVMDLYYFAKLPLREIAARINTRPDTLCRAVCRLREKLARCIERGLGGDAARV